MREDLARFFSIQKKAENVPKIYLGDIFRFFWGQIKYFPFPHETSHLNMMKIKYKKSDSHQSQGQVDIEHIMAQHKLFMYTCVNDD